MWNLRTEIYITVFILLTTLFLTTSYNSCPPPRPHFFLSFIWKCLLRWWLWPLQGVIHFSWVSSMYIWDICMYTQSCLTFWNLWTVAQQARLSMEFFQQEYWSGLPFPPPGDLPDPGIEPKSPALAGGFFTAEPPGKPFLKLLFYFNFLFQLHGLTCGILVPWSGIKPALRVLRAQSLSHWIFRKPLAGIFLLCNEIWVCLSQSPFWLWARAVPQETLLSM